MSGSSTHAGVSQCHSEKGGYELAAPGDGESRAETRVACTGRDSERIRKKKKQERPAAPIFNSCQGWSCTPNQVTELRKLTAQLTCNLVSERMKLPHGERDAATPK